MTANRFWPDQRPHIIWRAELGRGASHAWDAMRALATGSSLCGSVNHIHPVWEPVKPSQYSCEACAVVVRQLVHQCQGAVLVLPRAHQWTYWRGRSIRWPAVTRFIELTIREVE